MISMSLKLPPPSLTISIESEHLMNPFDNENGRYLVLVNDLEQHSLWPEQLAIPAGWEIRYGPAFKTECQGYIEKNWLSILPQET